MKGVVGFVVFSLLVVCALAQMPGDNDFVAAFNNQFNFEVIFANNTSYLDEIDDHRDIMYVAGEGNIREIVEEPFQISYHHQYFNQSHRFINFKAFVHYNLTWVFGPVDAYGVTGDRGVNHPLQIGNLTDTDTTVFPHSSQLAGIDATDMGGHVVVYGAGWAVRGDGFRTWANLTVWRLFVHPFHTQYHNGSFVTGNPFQITNESDHVDLPDNGYIEYTHSYKPWVFHSTYFQHVIVVDPATRIVYRFNAPNNTNSSFTLLTQTQPSYGHANITSAIYDHPTGILYLGTRGDGSNPGSIIAIDTTQNPMVTLFTKTLKEYESNPRALSLFNKFLYVGLNGGAYIMKIDLSNNAQTVGYATVPFYIRDVSGIHASFRHVYVVTSEQHSKVARTRNEDFCATPCDFFYGYCNNGTCACHPSHTLSSDGIRCTPNYSTTTVQSGRGGEIALGLLFALCLVAAVAGWVVVYRVKNGKSVPLISSSRYSALNHEEREGFLGSD